MVIFILKKKTQWFVVCWWMLTTGTCGLVQIVVRTLLWSFTKIKNTIGNGLIMQVPKKPAIDLYKMHANHTERYCTVSWSLEVSIPSINVFKACYLIKQTSPDIYVIAK